MSVLRLHHAGLYVANLERSIAFYHAVFGLDVAEVLSFGEEQIAFLAVGSARLELIETTNDPPRPGGVIDHVALEVDDLDALQPRLREHAVTLIDPTPIVIPERHARIQFCLGPDAERIELFEYV
jgi:catechol 2,3-dioxygenase-like lactoylglutathione lyase family enzyme